MGKETEESEKTLQLQTGFQFKILERTFAKIIFNHIEIKPSDCKIPPIKNEQTVLFGFGSIWKIGKIVKEIYLLREIGSTSQRWITEESLNNLLKAQQ